MKIKCLIIVLIILSSNFLFAQNLSFGLRDGASWSSITGRFDFKNFENTDIEKSLGHSFGLIINYQLSKYFILQTEFNYEMKGFDFGESLLGGALEGNYSMSYLTIPIIAHFEIGKNVKYYGYAGVYFGFLIKAENYTSLSSTSSSNLIVYDLSYDPTNIFNKSEFGGLVGLGIKFPLCEKVCLFIDTRYNFGLTKAAKNTDFDYESNYWSAETPDNFQNVYNRSLSISLGILYKLNKKKSHTESNNK